MCSKFSHFVQFSAWSQIFPARILDFLADEVFDASMLLPEVGNSVCVGVCNGKPDSGGDFDPPGRFKESTCFPLVA